MKTIKLLILSIFLIFLSGCGYKEGVVMEEKYSYLYFTGDAKGAEVTIDSHITFIIEKSGKEEHYKVTPGKHNIMIKKNGNLLVNRTLLLGDGIAREINIPSNKGNI